MSFFSFCGGGFCFCAQVLHTPVCFFGQKKLLSKPSLGRGLPLKTFFPLLKKSQFSLLSDQKKGPAKQKIEFSFSLSTGEREKKGKNDSTDLNEKNRSFHATST